MRLFEYIEQGGGIMYILLLANIIGFAILFWKIFTILDAKKRISDLVMEIKGRFSDSVKVGDNSMAIQLLKDEVTSKVHSLEFGLNTIKIIASVAPLLGLLGTVLGILSAFKVISEEGLSNPSLFAGGISMALITTVGGLIVAIPHFVGYNYLVGVLDDLEINLEKLAIKEIFGKSNGKES
jgi:biopolymer transport protein ExbB